MIVVLGVMFGICSCVARTMQISSSTSLLPAVLRTFRHQLYGDPDIAAAFLPHQGQPLAQGLIGVTTFDHKCCFHLVAFWALPRLVLIDVNAICHYSW
jgi:hypothetical protein